MTFAVISPFKIIRYSLISVNILPKRNACNNKWKILFFGTDNFSLSSLKALKCEQSKGIIDTLEVVSNTIGRTNAIMKYAKQENLTLHGWPLPSPTEGSFHLGIVVSFGHLIPERLIKSFPLGILNVHGSLLPRWRGAAPVVHALLNGDTRSGVTVMRIAPKRFDVGDIVAQKEMVFDNDILQPELHQRLGDLGAEALVDCLHQLPGCLDMAKPQDNKGATNAPKVTPALSNIDWQESSALQVYNLSRALYGIQPLLTKFNDLTIKLFKINLWNRLEEENKLLLPGYFRYIKEQQVIRVWCKDGHSVYFDTVGVPGKKNMSTTDFKNGFMKHVPEDKLLFSCIS